MKRLFLFFIITINTISAQNIDLSYLKCEELSGTINIDIQISNNTSQDIYLIKHVGKKQSIRNDLGLLIYYPNYSFSYLGIAGEIKDVDQIFIGAKDNVIVNFNFYGSKYKIRAVKVCLLFSYNSLTNIDINIKNNSFKEFIENAFFISKIKFLD